MDCEDARPLIDLDVDHELSPERAVEVAAHVEGCVACRAFAENLRQERSALRAKLPRFEAPPGLEARVRAGLGAAAPRTGTLRIAAYSRLAASLVLGALLGSVATYRAVRPAAGELLAHDLLTSHLRSLLSEERLVDVASSDHHTVRPWFAGKVDFAPPVLDLAEAGFPLVGGRVDYVANRRMAVLVYRHGAHVISLFIERRTGVQGAHRATEEGYGVVSWSEGGLDLRAISDVEAGELARFEGLFREGTEPPTRP